jgi:hypothetical protein
MVPTTPKLVPSAEMCSKVVENGPGMFPTWATPKKLAAPL